MFKSILGLAVALCLTGCQYHYALYIATNPEAPSQPAEAIMVQPKDTQPPVSSDGKSKMKPMSIAPGDFTATQSNGGSMVNVTINLNLVQPTSVSTDAALSGIPGF